MVPAATPMGRCSWHAVRCGVFADDVAAHAAGAPCRYWNRAFAVSASRSTPRLKARLVTRIVVDPVACDAYGYCAELLPEAITLDEWGYPVVDAHSRPNCSWTPRLLRRRDCPRSPLPCGSARAFTETAPASQWPDDSTWRSTVR